MPVIAKNIELVAGILILLSFRANISPYDMTIVPVYPVCPVYLLAQYIQYDLEHQYDLCVPHSYRSCCVINAKRHFILSWEKSNNTPELIEVYKLFSEYIKNDVDISNTINLPGVGKKLTINLY
jgi:hypothetical protein